MITVRTEADPQTPRLRRAPSLRRHIMVVTLGDARSSLAQGWLAAGPFGRKNPQTFRFLPNIQSRAAVLVSSGDRCFLDLAKRYQRKRVSTPMALLRMNFGRAR